MLPSNQVVTHKNNTGIVPRTIDDLAKFAEMLKKTPDFLPKHKQRYTVEQLIINMQYGMELGLTLMQSIQGVAIINGTPALWGDHLAGVVLATGKMTKFEEKYVGTFPDDDFESVCTVARGTLEVTRKFSIADAKKAGLWGRAVWKGYPKRMLFMRSRSWAIRDLFGDVLRGIVAVEEVIDYTEEADPLIVKSFGKPEVYNTKKPSSKKVVEIKDVEESIPNVIGYEMVSKLLEERICTALDNIDDPLNKAFPQDFRILPPWDAADEMMMYLKSLAESTGVDYTKILNRVYKNLDKAIQSFISERKKHV